MSRSQKITFGAIRSSGVRSVLVYSADYRCRHYITISNDRWEDDVRLSDIEPRFVARAYNSVSFVNRFITLPSRSLQSTMQPLQ
jgi:hypothetical protein